MKCARHDDADAVGQCIECGAGICADCAEATDGFSDHGMLCVNCVIDAGRDTIVSYAAESRWLLIKIIVSIVLYAAGAGFLIAAAIGEWDMNHIILMLVGVLLCGLFNGIAELKRTNNDIAKHEAKYGAEYTIDENGIHKNNNILIKIIGFIGGVFLGVIITPISIIRGFIKRSKNKKVINGIEAEIAKLQNV